MHLKLSNALSTDDLFIHLFAEVMHHYNHNTCLTYLIYYKKNVSYNFFVVFTKILMISYNNEGVKYKTPIQLFNLIQK